MIKADKNKTYHTAALGLLLGLTITVQLAGLPQPATGSVVNAVFFLGTFLYGWKSGLIIAVVTPFSALIRGHLPAILFPMLPFIAAGNAALVIVYYWISRLLQDKMAQTFILANIAGILAASFIKFLILASAVHFIIPLLVEKSIPRPFVLMFTFPQLLTAAAGGMIFLAGIRFLKLNKKT